MQRFGLAVLQSRLDRKLDGIHLARRRAVWEAVAGLLGGGLLWLTALGRSLHANTSLKHRIKAIDRLLGNKHLHREVGSFYAALATLLVRKEASPWIAVDWTEHGKVCTLSAALIHGTRALPLYNEAHPRKRLGNDLVQRRFLRALKKVLGPNVRPIIVTDAGFQRPWFDAVHAMGWHFVGRIRNKTKCRKKTGEWVSTKSFYAAATSKPRCLGVVELRREKPAPVRLVLFKKKLKGRTNLNKRGKRSARTDVRKCARRTQEPWLLAVSPTLAMSARRIVDIYSARFQIEQSFRDGKSIRFGWASKQAMTKHPTRLAVLYLIGTIGRFASELIGIAAEKMSLQRGLQANTERSRRVLSRFNLARLVLAELPSKTIRPNNILEALRVLRDDIARPAITSV